MIRRICTTKPSNARRKEFVGRSLSQNRGGTLGFSTGSIAEKGIYLV